MFHLDNSETSWLVYADWLEDQDIDAAHIREQLETEVNYWYFNNHIWVNFGNYVGDWEEFRYEILQSVGSFCSSGNVGADLPHRGVGASGGNWVAATEY